MTKKTQSLKIGISCPQEVGFQPRTGEGDTYLWLYTRRKKKEASHSGQSFLAPNDSPVSAPYVLPPEEKSLQDAATALQSHCK